MSERLLTREETAEALGVAMTTFKGWERDGFIPRAICEGKIVRYDLDTVKRTLAKRAAKRATATPPAGEMMVSTY